MVMSKDYKKDGILRLRLVVFIFLLFIINKCLSVALIPGLTLTRWVIHDSTMQEYDWVFIGSSECSRGISPQMINSILDCESFNLGTTATIYNGGVDASFYNLYAHNTPSNIAFMVSYGGMIGEENESVGTFAVNYPALTSVKAKAHYLYSTFHQKGELSRLFPWTVYHYNNISGVMSNLKNKFLDDAYKNCDLSVIQNSYPEYSGNGFLPLPTSDSENIYSFNDISVNAPGNVQTRVGFKTSESKLLESKVKGLTKMIQYAQKSGSNVYIIMAPIPDLRIYSTPEYYSVEQQIKEYCSKMGVHFVDINLIRQEEFRFSENAWYDLSHLNEDGANQYSEELAKIILRIERGEDVSGLFYQDWDSYVESIDYVIATFLTLKQDGDSLNLSALAATNPSNLVEYKFTACNSDGNDIEILQDFSEENTYSIEKYAIADGAAKLRVYARIKGDSNTDKYRYDTLPIE